MGQWSYKGIPKTHDQPTIGKNIRTVNNSSNMEGRRSYHRPGPSCSALLLPNIQLKAGSLYVW